jgi:hypothetical protein
MRCKVIVVGLKNVNEQKHSRIKQSMQTKMKLSDAYHVAHRRFQQLTQLTIAFPSPVMASPESAKEADAAIDSTRGRNQKSFMTLRV